ncbi:hypothetical protein BsWGS_19093 [Bradybaena similaris]
MEVSTEISQKIRSAIKAKLMELGAYVDDELPDYIMVMVANKRSRAQMNKDLGLFLGSHTSSFTEWLHSLLAKLQTIRSDFDNKSADKRAKGGKVKVKDKPKGDKQIDGLDSVAKQQENLHSADVSAENQNDVQSSSCDGNKYKHSGDARESGGSSSKPSIKSENNDIVRADLFTNTTPMDAVSEEETMDSEVVPVGVDTNSASASLSPDRGQSYSVNRKRKAPSSLADGSKESPSEVFHPYDNPAFDGISSELTADNSRSLQVRRNTDDGASGEATNAHRTELPDHDDQPPQKVIKLAESVQLEDIKRALAEVLESTIRDDDISHFSRMLESSLRKLRPPVVSLAKMRIQQILCEFETVAVQEENLGVNEPNANKGGQAICLSNDLKFSSSGKHSRSLAISGSESVRNLLEGRHNSSPSPQDDSSLLQKKEGNENSDHLVDNVGIFQPKINSGNLRDHITVSCEYSSPDIRVNSEPHDSHVGKVVFHSKRTNSQKSIETTVSSSKAFDTVGRSGDRESALAKRHDQSPQSPISLGKADISSPSSVHSCPLTSTLSLRVKRNVSSASRESTVSPDDLQSQPGSSHITRTKLTSSKNKILPSILVDSIHSRKRPESSESASVLRQSWHKDVSPRPVDSSKPDVQDSPKQYGPEALKVMAKNLRITVINKRAVKSPQVSSSDDSDDEDDDTSDNDDEEENEDVKVNKSSIAKMKTSTASQKKVISDHSLA